MRAVVQRVSHAKVEVDDKIVGEIGQGLLIFVGVEKGDTEQDAEYIANKTAGMRIFKDDEDKMNLSIMDTIEPSILAISQFTLSGDCRHGRRPSFTTAEDPERANQLYLHLIELLKNRGIKTEQGVFRANMQVSLCNSGPVTILLDSKKLF